MPQGLPDQRARADDPAMICEAVNGTAIETSAKPLLGGSWNALGLASNASISISGVSKKSVDQFSFAQAHHPDGILPMIPIAYQVYIAAIMPMISL